MDIVERLRERMVNSILLLSDPPQRVKDALCHAAADEIERLRHELERIADVSERWPDSLVSQINEIARAALNTLKGE